jgi:DNA-directed RNA polymerase specialized sigma24 family protein
VVEFDEYVAARGQQLVRLGLVLSADHHRAEDLAQTALMNAYRHWRRLRTMDDPHAYVRRTLVNAHISATRRSSSRETPSDLPDSGRSEPDPSLALTEHDAVWRMLAKLPTRERTAIVGGTDSRLKDGRRPSRRAGAAARRVRAATSKEGSGGWERA